MGDDKDWDFKVNDKSLKSTEIKKGETKPSALNKAKRKSAENLKMEKASPTSFRQGRRGELEKEKANKEILINPAGITDRLMAFLIDALFIGLVSYFIPMYVKAIPDLIGGFIAVDSIDPRFIEMSNIKNSQFILIGLTYICFVIFPLGINGKTVGLKIKNLTLEDIDGGNIGILRAVLRQTLGMALNVGIVVGMILPLFNKKKRCLHDFLFKSICVKDE